MSANGELLVFRCSEPLHDPGNTDHPYTSWIYLRDLATGQLDHLELTTSDGTPVAAGDPRVSADGDRIAFRVDREFHETCQMFCHFVYERSTQRLIGPVPGPGGYDSLFSADGSTLYLSPSADVRYTVDIDTGEWHEITGFDRHEFLIRELAPDGSWVLGTSTSALDPDRPDASGLYRMWPATREIELIREYDGLFGLHTMTRDGRHAVTFTSDTFFATDIESRETRQLLDRGSGRSVRVSDDLDAVALTTTNQHDASHPFLIPNLYFTTGLGQPDR